MATPIEQLQSFLVATHPVDEEIFDLLKASGVESISDYIGLYAESEYEDGLKEWTEKSQNFRGNKIQLSRLRIAWVTGRKELLRDTPLESTDDVDFEAPLPADVRQKQDDLFYQKFNTKLPLELTPAAPLFNRHFREFRKQAKTLDDLSKVKSAVDASAPVPQKGGTSFRDVLSLLRAHQILLNSWAMTGTTERRSKINPSPHAPVTDFALADALWYHTFVTDHLRAHPGPADEAIRWTLDRDRQTRQAAVALYGDGWPLSEALRISVEQKTAVLWQIGPMGALADAHGQTCPALTRWAVGSFHATALEGSRCVRQVECRQLHKAAAWLPLAQEASMLFSHAKWILLRCLAAQQSQAQANKICLGTAPPLGGWHVPRGGFCTSLAMDGWLRPDTALAQQVVWVRHCFAASWFVVTHGILAPMLNGLHILVFLPKLALIGRPSKHLTHQGPIANGSWIWAFAWQPWLTAAWARSPRPAPSPPLCRIGASWDRHTICRFCIGPLRFRCW